MYSSKPLSLFKSHPETAARPPPEGRNSGYIVVKGDEDEDDDDEMWCWGSCGGTRVRGLPFPEDCPIASNRYYTVVATGKRKGLLRTCSREEDMTPCCFSRCIKDVKPRSFDPSDAYQQIEIVQRQRGRLIARAIATDGFPSYLYWQMYWRMQRLPLFGQYVYV
ncbi:uncharacterized protein [Lolium perenne]|uniref:uncharacterized protein n=1 Tax=Lolium perenne TaxID=4522 RepID=UPI0021F5ECB9|nr:uncharacterized protein LOC127347718 [Lolium perenne]